MANKGIPTVTSEDLNNFHQSHYGSPAPGSSSAPAAEQAAAAEEDDGLGYYPDGTKRTLTEDQIAMFRHSEIQRLLQARRLKREAEAESAERSASSGSDMVISEDEEKAGQTSRAHKTATNEPEMTKTKVDYKHEPTAKQTPHRRARELDAVQATSVELDY